MTSFLVWSPSVPTAAPLNISVHPINETSAFMYWMPPPLEHHNGLLRGYSLVVNELETGTVLEREAENSSLLLTSLHPFNTYRFVIAAKTIGLGPFSRPVTFQMPPAGILLFTEFQSCSANYIFVFLFS